MRIVCLGLFLVSSVCQGHARIDPNGEIKPRSTNAGLKAGPCGGITPGAPVTLTAGSEVIFKWEETINHPGWYRIAFSPGNDLDFDKNILIEKIEDTKNDNSLPHKYEIKIKLPDVECTSCALQLIQVMTDRNPPTNYYSCSDVKLVKAKLPETDPPIYEQGASPPALQAPEIKSIKWTISTDTDGTTNDSK